MVKLHKGDGKPLRSVWKHLKNGGKSLREVEMLFKILPTIGNASLFYVHGEKRREELQNNQPN